MLIKRFGRTPLLMAPAGDDDGGGGEATTIDDHDTTTTGDDTATGGDRGDELETPLDAEALKKVAGADDAAGEDKTKGSGHVPIGRFNEVNEKKKALERENADLKARIDAAPKPPAATPAPTEAPKKFDEDAAEREYATLLAEGEFDKAVAKRKEINANLREQVREEAEANVTRTLEQRDTVQTLTQVAQQAVKDWPYLDTEEGADTMNLIIAARDGYVAKGVPIAKALKDAVDKIAPKYAPEGDDTPGKDSTRQNTGTDTRTQQATARGAEASTKQPPRLDGGAGSRATQGRVNVEDLDEDQFAALSPAEKRRLRGDAG